MRYLWNPTKQRKNLKKHGIEFADAAVALEDENALTVTDKDSQCEYRFQTLCVSSEPEVLLVVHTEEHEGLITIISARLAEPSERHQYFEGLNHGH